MSGRGGRAGLRSSWVMDRLTVVNKKFASTKHSAVRVFQYSLGNFVLMSLSGGIPISILTADPFL